MRATGATHTAARVKSPRRHVLGITLATVATTAGCIDPLAIHERRWSMGRGWGFAELALGAGAPRVTFHRYGLPGGWRCPRP